MTARLISAFSSQWEALRSNEFRRTTEVVAKHINLLGMCGSSKRWMVGMPCWRGVRCVCFRFALSLQIGTNTHSALIHPRQHHPVDSLSRASLINRSPPGVCEAEPEGVLSPLVTFNVPSFVFGIEPIQVIDG